MNLPSSSFTAYITKWNFVSRSAFIFAEITVETLIIILLIIWRRKNPFWYKLLVLNITIKLFKICVYVRWVYMHMFFSQAACRGNKSNNNCLRRRNSFLLLRHIILLVSPRCVACFIKSVANIFINLFIFKALKKKVKHTIR